MPGFTSKLLSTLVLSVCLVAGLQSANLLRDDLLFTRAKTEVSFWGRGNYHPDAATVSRTELQLEALLASAPAHPDYLALQANRYAWQAYWAEDESLSQHYAKQALAAQRAALESRPAHRHSWAKMVEYTARLQTVEH